MILAAGNCQDQFMTGSTYIPTIHCHPQMQTVAEFYSVHKNASTNQVEVASAVYRVTAISPGVSPSAS